MSLLEDVKRVAEKALAGNDLMIPRRCFAGASLARTGSRTTASFRTTRDGHF
jgi:hypothetical protein